MGGEVLVGVVGGVLRGFLAEDSGGLLAVDIDGGGGFVDGGEAQGDDEGRKGDGGDECADAPGVAAENPEVVRQGDLGGLGLEFRVDD